MKFTEELTGVMTSKKIISFLLLLVLVFATGFYIGTSEPTITGAAVAKPGFSEKTIYLDNVDKIVNQTAEILYNVNDYTKLAAEEKIDNSLYKEMLIKDLGKIQNLKSQVYSITPPEEFKNHNEGLKKEFDYYELTIKQMLDNIK